MAEKTTTFQQQESMLEKTTTDRKDISDSDFNCDCCMLWYYTIQEPKSKTLRAQRARQRNPCNDCDCCMFWCKIKQEEEAKQEEKMKKAIYIEKQ